MEAVQREQAKQIGLGQAKPDQLERNQVVKDKEKEWEALDPLPRSPLGVFDDDICLSSDAIHQQTPDQPPTNDIQLEITAKL